MQNNVNQRSDTSGYYNIFDVKIDDKVINYAQKKAQVSFKSKEDIRIISSDSNRAPSSSIEQFVWNNPWLQNIDFTKDQTNDNDDDETDEECNEEIDKMNVHHVNPFHISIKRSKQFKKQRKFKPRRMNKQNHDNNNIG